MCIIIYKPAGVYLTDEALSNSFDNNPHGAGIACRHKNSKISIHKGIFKKEHFIKCYNKYKNLEMILHARIATSGKINAACCHPFPISSDMFDMKQPYIYIKKVMAHNGTIYKCKPEPKSKISDTMIFVRDILSKVDYNNKGIECLIDDFIGLSRIAIMDETGHKLIGEWEEKDGIFYSNDSYKTLKPKAVVINHSCITQNIKIPGGLAKKNLIIGSLRLRFIFPFNERIEGDDLYFSVGFYRIGDAIEIIKEIVPEAEAMEDKVYAGTL